MKKHNKGNINWRANVNINTPAYLKCSLVMVLVIYTMG